jgi:hypothetical protein
MRNFLLGLVAFASLQLPAQMPDPGVMGTHAVLKGEYNLGDEAFTPPPAAMIGADLEVRGSVHYPSDLANGPYPVLVWLHGRHTTCYQTSNPSNTQLDWPCPAGYQPITSYAGYDYAARTMASHGYVVISISANAINANDASLSDKGGNARGVLVQHHLDLWNAWSSTDSTGPFGSLFIGALDLQNVGTMGHSRGGEGVIFNYEYNQSLGSPYGINAVLTLAPIDQNRHFINQVALMNIAPYCDGDVTNLPGVYYYDDARFFDNTDEQPKHNVLLLGANHNFFNTVWTPGSYIAGTADDWLYVGSSTSNHCGPSSGTSGRLDTTQQKAIFNAYAAAFFRRYVGGEEVFDPLLTTDVLTPPASALVDSTEIYVSFHPGRTDRLDLNTTDSLGRDVINTMGGTVSLGPSMTSSPICGGGITMTACDAGLGSSQRPHRGTSTTDGLGQMRLEWSATNAYYDNEVPVAYQDLSEVQSLLFRACLNFPVTSVANLNFDVQLIDSAGNVSSQPVRNHTHAFFKQPGTASFLLPKLVFNTVRIPISSFSGVDLHRIRHVRFAFDLTASSSILVSDLAFLRAECAGLDVVFTTDSLGGLDYAFHETVTAGPRDTVSLSWNFGDPASGASNTSTSSNPSHTFSTDGVYEVCLYLETHRPNGDVCHDTLCSLVTVSTPVSLLDAELSQLTLYPNPATDEVHIAGTSKPLRFALIDLLGQEVFSAQVQSGTVSLPPSLSAGIYVAAVTTAGGTVFKKLVVE